MSAVLQKAKSRGHWKVVIRPEEFRETRVPDFSTLSDLISRTTVAFRGWDFPHSDIHAGHDIGINWIGQEVDWSEHVETWRLYQSGQFVFIGSIFDDWQDQSIWEPPKADWRPGAYLPVMDTVFRFTEIYEFAARLALSYPGVDIVRVEITLVGLKGRTLRMDHRDRSGFITPRTCAIPEFPYSRSLPREQLAAEASDLALENTNELFTRFHWSPGVEFLRGMQEERNRR